MARKSAEEMQKTISLLYRAVSKVTAEVPDFKGKPQKQAYSGTFDDLFSGIETGQRTITKFIWVITHKVGALSQPLFKRDENNALVRNCSGFYAYQDQPDGTKEKVHIIGEALVPYLYQWMQDYKPTPRQTKDEELDNVIEVAVAEKGAKEFPQRTEDHKVDLTQVSTEDLAAELTARGWTITYGLI